MRGYVQRNPYSQKATWWKKFDLKQSIGVLVVYVATETIGFFVDSLTNMLTYCKLNKGKLSTDDTVIYINITETIESSLTPTKAIRLNKRFWVFNIEKLVLEEHDIVDEELEIILAETSKITRFNKNFYIRQCSFDYVEESDEQENVNQPIGGLLIESSRLTIKTQNFELNDSMPRAEDIITCNCQNWLIEETSKSVRYTPKKRLDLYINLRVLK